MVAGFIGLAAKITAAAPAKRGVAALVLLTPP
jgi:hypothetical protein